jgi:hypothetical protein
MALTLKWVEDGDPLPRMLARDLKKLLESKPDEIVNEIRNIGHPDQKRVENRYIRSRRRVSL